MSLLLLVVEVRTARPQCGNWVAFPGQSGLTRANAIATLRALSRNRNQPSFISVFTVGLWRSNVRLQSPVAQLLSWPPSLV